MKRNISSYNPDTHLLYIREGASREEIQAVLKQVPLEEVNKLKLALERVIDLRKIERAFHKS